MVSQLLLNSLISAALYALVGVGFAIIFRVLGFFHFTHGLSFVVAAYVLFACRKWTAIPFILTIIIAITVTICLNLLFNILVFRRLSRNEDSQLTALIASIGLYTVGQNVIAMLFGDGAQSLRSETVQQGIAILGARITPVQIVTVACSAVVIGVVHLWLILSQSGTHIRALSDDRELASIVGISTQRTTLLAIAVGSMLAAIAGILASLDRDLVPTMGMGALLMGIVATIVGGASSVVGVTLAALFVSLTQNLSILVLPAAWQDTMVFFVLIVFLIFRPEGFAGRKLHSWAV